MLPSLFAPEIYGWKMKFLVGWPIFRGEHVSFRECNSWVFDGKKLKITLMVV